MLTSQTQHARRTAGVAIPVLVAALVAGSSALSAQISVVVTDHRGNPVDDAVVTATPAGGSAQGTTVERAVMDQIDETFVPHVLAVPTGTSVQFPNHDDVRHHVYSFSEPKNFELPLYEGTPANPVVFDQPGSVVLGCNIHDWMRGYIFVTDAPHFAPVTEGRGTLEGLADGTYTVEVWHPLQRGNDNWSGEATVQGGAATELSAEIRLKPALKVRRAPKAGKTEYR